MIDVDPNHAVVAAAADLHCVALPGSTISKLGSNYARAFYRYAKDCESEAVFVAHDDSSSVVGAAVLTLDPSGLSRRLFLRTPLLVHAIWRPLLAVQLARGLFTRQQSQRENTSVHELPEVLAIFTDRPYRSRGTGKELLRAIEAYLTARSFDRYVVRTLAHANNRAVRFYEREGFKHVGKVSAQGNLFQLLVKEIGSNG
jgi:ribosomal protein S18 acetylase RimI-like enzyme